MARASGQSSSEVRRLADAIDHLNRRLDRLTSVAPDSFDYFAFEQRFRGTSAEIQRRQSIYLELFLERRCVVDLGCGRGEFVDLLRQHQVGVVGVDDNDAMVACCAARGLPVIHADLFDYLEAQADASLDGITALQVVEHMPPMRILELLQTAARKLTTGSPLVAETVNPACAVALGNFFLDPTHCRPIPAPLLAYMFEQVGLLVTTLRLSAPLSASATRTFLDFDPTCTGDLANYQDYAVIGMS